MTIFNFLSLIIENRAMLGEKESGSDFTAEVQKCLQQQLISVWKSKLVTERTVLNPLKLIYRVFNTTSDYHVPT